MVPTETQAGEIPCSPRLSPGPPRTDCEGLTRSVPVRTASLEKAGPFLKRLFRHHITVRDGPEVLARPWPPSLGNALDQTALLGCFCLRRVVGLSKNPFVEEKSVDLLTKSICEELSSGCEGQCYRRGLKTLEWATRPSDEGTLGTKREELRVKWFGFQRRTKGFFRAQGVQNGCARSSLQTPIVRAVLKRSPCGSALLLPFCPSADTC